MHICLYVYMSIYVACGKRGEHTRVSDVTYEWVMSLWMKIAFIIARKEIM